MSGKAGSSAQEFLLFEFSQGAAVIPNRAVLGNPGETAQLV